MVKKKKSAAELPPDAAVRATFEAFVDAVARRDFAAFCSLHVEAQRAGLDPGRFQRNAERAQKQGLQFRLLRALHEGDVAEVAFEVTPRGSGASEPDVATLVMVRVGDAYQIVES